MKRLLFVNATSLAYIVKGGRGGGQNAPLKVGSWAKDISSVCKIVLSFMHGIEFSYYSESDATEESVGFAKNCRGFFSGSIS